ncbi:MAG: hypothetical protein WDW36_009059 [Sanguina aurantia]
MTRAVAPRPHSSAQGLGECASSHAQPLHGWGGSTTCTLEADKGGRHLLALHSQLGDLWLDVVDINAQCKDRMGVTDHKGYAMELHSLLCKDQRLVMLLQDLSRRLLAGEAGSVHHIPSVPNTDAQSRLQVTSLLFRENSSSTFPAMLIEHQVPSQEEQAAHQLHLEHTILSMLPSSITVFNLGGFVVHQNDASVSYMGHLCGRKRSGGDVSLDHPQHPLRQLFAKDVAALEELLDVVSLGQEFCSIVRMSSLETEGIVLALSAAGRPTLSSLLLHCMQQSVARPSHTTTHPPPPPSAPNPVPATFGGLPKVARTHKRSLSLSLSYTQPSTLLACLLESNPSTTHAAVYAPPTHHTGLGGHPSAAGTPTRREATPLSQSMVFSALHSAATTRFDSIENVLDAMLPPSVSAPAGTAAAAANDAPAGSEAATAALAAATSVRSCPAPTVPSRAVHVSFSAAAAAAAHRFAVPAHPSTTTHVSRLSESSERFPSERFSGAPSPSPAEAAAAYFTPSVTGVATANSSAAATGHPSSTYTAADSLSQATYTDHSVTAAHDPSEAPLASSPPSLPAAVFHDSGPHIPPPAAPGHPTPAHPPLPASPAAHTHERPGRPGRPMSIPAFGSPGVRKLAGILRPSESGALARSHSPSAAAPTPHTPTAQHSSLPSGSMLASTPSSMLADLYRLPDAHPMPPSTAPAGLARQPSPPCPAAPSPSVTHLGSPPPQAAASIYGFPQVRWSVGSSRSGPVASPALAPTAPGHTGGTAAIRRTSVSGQGVFAAAAATAAAAAAGAAAAALPGPPAFGAAARMGHPAPAHESASSAAEPAAITHSPSLQGACFSEPLAGLLGGAQPPSGTRSISLTRHSAQPTTAPEPFARSPGETDAGRALAQLSAHSSFSAHREQGHAAAAGLKLRLRAMEKGGRSILRRESTVGGPASPLLGEAITREESHVASYDDSQWISQDKWSAQYPPGRDLWSLDNPNCIPDDRPHLRVNLNDGCPYPQLVDSPAAAAAAAAGRDTPVPSSNRTSSEWRFQKHPLPAMHRASLQEGTKSSSLEASPVQFPGQPAPLLLPPQLQQRCARRAAEQRRHRHAQQQAAQQLAHQQQQQQDLRQLGIGATAPGIRTVHGPALSPHDARPSQPLRPPPKTMKQRLSLLLSLVGRSSPSLSSKSSTPRFADVPKSQRMVPVSAVCTTYHQQQQQQQQQQGLRVQQPQQPGSLTYAGALSRIQIHMWSTMRRESSRMHLASASHPNNNATSPSIAQSPGGDNTSAHGAVWHEVRARLMPVPNSSQLLLLVIQTDVTNRVRLEERVTQALEAEHQVLSNIFPRHVIKHMTGASRAPPSRNASGGDGGSLASRMATSHAAVSILFADIVGFTSMCDITPAQDVMCFLNDLYVRFDDLLDIYGEWGGTHTVGALGSHASAWGLVG